MYPVHYGTGQLALSAVDIESAGFSVPWGHTRSFASRQSYNETLGNGFNWHVEQWPFLIALYDGRMVIQGRANSPLWFRQVNGGYVGEFFIKETLVHDAGANVYRLFELDGSYTEFSDSTGVFRRQVDPAGNKIEVQSLGPIHTIDLGGVATSIRRATWWVYKDADHELWVGQGYATGENWDTFTLINPVSITKFDKNGQVLESIETVRSTTSGKLTASDSFPQSSSVRWTTNQYTDCCFLASTRVYHTIPASGEGSSGTNYDQTTFGYDSSKRMNRQVTPGGTITRTVFDARGNPWKMYVGTDDTGATADDPTGGGAAGNNMVLVTENQFDGGTDGGDNNLTQQTQHVDGSTTRVTSFTYDWRDRRTDEDGEVDLYRQTFYDNLDRVIKVDHRDTTANGNLVARSETKFDDRGRVYQTIRYGVDPSTGNVGNSLTGNKWYDAAGNPIKELPAGSKLFTKSVYDGLARRTKESVGYDLDETAYSEASSLSDDTLIEQTVFSYDAASNLIQTDHRQRFHNATGTGDLNGPVGVQPKSRITYTAMWPDALGRAQATANYGTNGGTSLSRPSTIPARGDTVLVSSLTYNSAGHVTTQTNPGGIVTCLQYDATGRQVKVILNCTGGSSSSSSSSSSDCPTSDDTDVTVMTAYNADGNVSSITAVNSITGNQTTQYIYGTTLADSDIASSLLNRKEIYPDSADSDDEIRFKYNRQGEVKEVRDQNGTVHAFDFDKLGRPTQDRATTLETGVDGGVRRIATSYEVRGMREKITSWNSETVGSGSVVNEVRFAYSNFAQVTHDYQAHSGVVNTSTTPKVQYGYANGSANTVRPTTLTYPDGRVLTYSYGSADSMPDALSRVAGIVDDDAGSTHLADYSYLGLGTFVEVDYTEPDIEYTLVGIAGGNDPDTGDIYRGLDHFGRVKDSYWYDYGSSSDVDRIKYGYDRNGSRLYRENTVATANNAYFDEKYLYDLIDRLKHMDRGRLTAQKDGVTDKTFAQCWTLDATGNWRKFLEDSDGDGSWSLDQTRTANKVNEITDLTESIGASWVTPAYSRAGNMTTIPKPADPIVGYTGTYDAWNRLVRIEEGANKVAEYEYDGAKRRTLKKTYVSGILDQMRHFYYTEPSKWQIVEERVESSSDAERRFVWGLRYVDDLILRDRDTDADATFDERLYGMQDANWNVTSLKDTGGAVQERYAYSGYGEPVVLTPSFGSRTVSSFDWELRFAGYRFDSESGLYYVRNRICHSAVSWFQRDPLGLSAGVNPYQYVHGRPLVLTDASGRDICDCCNFAVQEERKRFPGNQIESRSGRRRCRLIISCERGCRAGRTPFPATTTVDAGGTIRICIDCRLGNVNIAATIIHELEHARDYCDTPRPTIDLPTCIQWETNACRAQCAFYQGGPNSIDDPAAYQRCIDCCVYFSCKHHGAPAPVPECQEFQVPTKPCFKWIPGRGFEYDPSDPRCPASHRR